MLSVTFLIPLANEEGWHVLLTLIVMLFQHLPSRLQLLQTRCCVSPASGCRKKQVELLSTVSFFLFDFRSKTDRRDENVCELLHWVTCSHITGNAAKTHSIKSSARKSPQTNAAALKKEDKNTYFTS